MWVKIVVGSHLYSERLRPVFFFSSQTPRFPNTPGMANDGDFRV